MSDRDIHRDNPILRKELTLFAGLLGFGLLLLPIAVFLVGRAVFGDYGGGDYFDFAATLYQGLGRGELTVWFLLLSPYIVWQALRLTIAGFRRTAQKP